MVSVQYFDLKMRQTAYQIFFKKELSLYPKLKLSNPYISLQPDSVNYLYFIHILFHLTNLWFEISQDYEIGLQRY